MRAVIYARVEFDAEFLKILTPKLAKDKIRVFINSLHKKLGEALRTWIG
jgi:hypothetical protein